MVEIDLISVEEVELDLISLEGVEIELVSVDRWNWFDCCVGSWNWLIWAKYRGSELTCTLVCGPNTAWFYSVSMKINLIFCVCDQLELTSERGIELFLFFGVGIKLIRLLCRWMKLACFQCGGSELTWFQCRDRKRLGFCVTVKNDLFLVHVFYFIFTSVFVSGHRNRLNIWLGIQIDLRRVMGSKFTLFHGGSNLTRFLCWWSKCFWYQYGALKLTSFQCRNWNWLGFCVGFEKCLVIYSVLIEINLVLGPGIKSDVILAWGIELDVIAVLGP